MWVKGCNGRGVNLAMRAGVAPVLLSEKDDIWGVKAVEPGTRLDTELLFKGTQEQCNAYIDSLLAQLGAQAAAGMRLAAALETLAGAVVTLPNGEAALNVYDNSRVDQ